MSSCIAIHTSSSKRIVSASTGTSSLKRLAMFCWQPPIPAPARNAAHCARSLSQGKQKLRGVRDLLRRYPGVISTRVGYADGEVPNATYRNHRNHAEAIEIVF